MTAAASTFRVERQRSENSSSFRLIGKLEGASVRTLERVLAGPSADGGVVRLDLGLLESCDASGIALLVSLTKRAHIAAGDFVLQNVSCEMRAMFCTEDALTKLHLGEPDAVERTRD
jgi:anti-anti-sigma factor